ncbi:hypothetical protein [Streptomyces sp. NPDC052535]|uniref:hypothetical protein n=1 Tax=Streptomyces sp. NPDC052535 TaxID=3155531 RepID=UPI003417B3AE
MSDDIAFARPFVLRRDRDISDVSGTGIIADGVLFPDGHAAIHWRGRWPLTTPHPDGMDSIIAIHDHGGRGDLHVVWPDQATVRSRFRSDLAELFAVPAAVVWGTEQERDSRYREIENALRSAAASWQKNGSALVFTLGSMHVAGEFPALAAAIMPIVDDILAARDRAQKTAGRAYLLADRWEAAHGSANLLVRAAGVELREALDNADQGPLKPGPLTGIEVRDPCPYCEGCPLIPRMLMDDHVREHHPEVQTVEPGAPVPPADDEVERVRNLLLARFGADQADVVDRLIRAVERRSYCDLPHEMEV